MHYFNFLNSKYCTVNANWLNSYWLNSLFKYYAGIQLAVIYCCVADENKRNAVISNKTHWNFIECVDCCFGFMFVVNDDCIGNSQTSCLSFHFDLFWTSVVALCVVHLICLQHIFWLSSCDPLRFF